MSSIRLQISMILFVTFCAVCGFGYLTFASFQKYSAFNESLDLSYRIQDHLESVKISKFDSADKKLLVNWRENLKPNHRMEALSAVIQAYGDKKNWLLKKRIQFFVKNEVEFRNYTRPILSYLKSRIEYYGVICLFLIFSSLFLVFLYFQYQVFRPLQNLSKKMIDFLNDRYTYQFSVPKPNEIGRVQSTFDSMAQRVLSQMEDLTALDKAKSEFLSIASHELRTPLTSIKGSLSLLKSGVVGKVNEAAENLVNIAGVETDRLIRLINDVLDLAKIESRRLPLNKEWSSYEQLAKDTLQGIEGLAVTAKVKLTLDPMPNIQVFMDKDRIQQVMTNLLSNAIKYSPEGGEVTLCCQIDSEGQLRTEVKDQGEGINPEDQELIFEKFRQATGPNNPLVKGTGLGLAIAKALLEEHSGTIGVTSTAGAGSCFYFTLPEWEFSQNNQQDTTKINEVAA